MWQMKQYKNSIKILLALTILAITLIGCGKDDDKDETNGDQPSQESQTAQEEFMNQLQVADLGLEGSQEVAEYQGGKVTAAEFERHLHLLTYFSPQNPAIADAASWPEILKSYIGDRVLSSRAVEAKIEINNDEVNDIYTSRKESMVQFFQSEESYQAFLTKLELEENDVKNFIQQYLLIDNYLGSQVNEDELRKAYDENQSEYTLASVRQILILTENRTDEEAKKLADDLAERARGGEDFATLAKEYSEDPGSKDNGGLYENAPVNGWVEEFKQAALELPLNEVSDPVKTDYGYHVMRVEERSVRSFEEVKEELKSAEIYNQYVSFVNDELPGLIEKTNLPEAKK